MKKNIVFYLALILFSFAFQSCEHWEGETVESAYRMPTIPDPSYQFKRNGSSSVDYLELCIKPIWIRCKTTTLTVSLD